MNSHATAPVAAPVSAAVLYQPKPLDLAAGRPNEVGEIPILEYHQLIPDGMKPKGLKYPITKFHDDMEKLYSLGYLPVNLSEVVTGKIDCPAGKSPVVLTFDDALPGQIDYTDDGKISPTCAVGVLQAMHQEHSDWPLRGTFFVLTRPGMGDYFFQSQYSQSKLQWLVANGFELGNHTVHHLLGIKHWPDERVESEFALAAKQIDDNVPGYNVDLLALPYGVFPKNQKLVQYGSYNGIKYKNICAMLAGAAPVPAPVTKDFNPYRMQRIIPGNGRYMFGYWMDYLQKHPDKRYVSDGDPNTVTVPQTMAGVVVDSRLEKLGLHKRMY